MNVDLKWMRSFVAVAEELHFGRAAQRLGLSQPPLSKQIQQLEAELGCVLFLRTRRNVELTAAGRAFLEEARATLRQAERAVEAARAAESDAGGRLLVGFIDAAVYSVLPQIVRAYADRRPSVELVLADMLIPDQLEAIVERRLHVGLVHPPVERADLISATIFSEPMCLALPVDHRMASASEIEWRDLAGEPLVLFPRAVSPQLYDEVLGMCRRAGFEPRVVQHASPKQTIVGLVSVGLGSAILPARLSALRREGVVYRPLAGLNIRVDTAVVRRADETSPAVRDFIEIAMRVGGLAPSSLA